LATLPPRLQVAALVLPWALVLPFVVLTRAVAPVRPSSLGR